jgi:hypothetical protein
MNGIEDYVGWLDTCILEYGQKASYGHSLIYYAIDMITQ